MSKKETTAMNINQLFCTPEQGKRLTELVQELTSAFMWAQYDNFEPFITDKKAIVNGAFIEYDCTYTPALTLQELRDMALEKLPIGFNENFGRIQNLIVNSTKPCTAPELAAWVIERLEGVER